jgi:hypothetical protein
MIDLTHRDLPRNPLFPRDEWQTHLQYPIHIFGADERRVHQLEKYMIIEGPGDFYYEFTSEGPKGRIKKVVKFTPLNEYEDGYYNLYLGDWLEAENRLSDTAVRLYQIAITTHWQEINEDFDLHGFRHNKWEKFQKDRNYEAFLLRRK